MDVTATPTVQGNAQTTLQAQSSTTSINSDFDTFLKMLTAQLTNQDPLNPLDSQDFAVQLATFSSVEQQTKTNDLLTELTNRFTASGTSQLANWVGREARVTADATFSGSPLTLYPDIPEAATKAELVVKDSTGREVDRRAITLDAREVLWTGEDENGETFPNGPYTFTVEAVTSGDATTTAPVAHYARITEARLTTGDERLVLHGGVLVAPDEVIAIRAANSSSTQP
ncbi:flagellar hook capping FlgD N-terminal domain-containing protein [Actibacterium sp. 188UL27-1]|uniref:flagellar hook capping FlgD N-terminal domain-containing protein n=1 Tax=Actibacterium sp. 188UL27-1 TaxID=2786961 RepID=UPI00195CD9F1|nr:flagellar hook capping FlgD N-terminal domain-containing protein [Actibacterium sp. 188UL27-1]MBM7069899.1 flagellar hook assembly protein FlgD [Actibacterium sp. 188UL27-1]